MIKFYDQVPSVYTRTSRDFQYLSWLINIVLNSVKHNVDSIYHLPSCKADPRLAELLALTLGFKVKRNYAQDQLVALVNAIPSILKHKGTKTAVCIAAMALINSSGAVGNFDEYKHLKENSGVLEIVLPEDLIDTALFTDLLPYILPAGMTCRIVRKTETLEDVSPIELGYYDVPVARWHKDLSFDSEKHTSVGLANMFDTSSNNRVPLFTNYSEHSSDTFNAGLLNNSVIPVLGKGDAMTDLDLHNYYKDVAEEEENK